jgi:hypothetical protein
MEFVNIVFDIFTLPLYLFFFLFVGKFLYGDLRKFFDDAYLNAFLQIIFGFMLTISCYALFKTSGKSIMVLLLLLLVFQYGYLKMRPDTQWYRKICITDVKTIALFFGFAIVFLGVQLLRHDYFNPDIMKLGWSDYVFYSDLAESFNVYGIEKVGSWDNYFNSESLVYKANPIPYHYFEIWTQALFLNTTFNNGVFVFIYVFTPFICALVALGFFVLGRSLLKITSIYKTPILLLSAILMPFFMGKLPFLGSGFIDNLIYFPRNYMFYILFVCFFLFYRKGYKRVALYFLALLSCVNILYLPTVSTVLVLLAVFQYFRNKNNKKLALHAVFLAVSLAVFVFVFYFVLFKNEGGSGMDMSVFDDIKTYLSDSLHRYFRAYLARAWFFYLPAFLVFIWYFWQTRRTITKNQNASELIFVIIVMYLISLVFTSFVPHLEAFSFHNTLLNPMLAVVTFVGLMYVFNTVKALASKILVGLLFLQLFYSLVFVVFHIGGYRYEGANFSKTFLKEVAQLNINNKIGGFYKNREHNERSPFNAKSNLSGYSSIFDVKGNGFFQVNINTPIKEEHIPFKSIRDSEMNTPMFKYGSAKITENPSLTRASIDLDFIKDYHIEYIVFNKGAKIPDYLLPLVKRTVQDSSSKVKIVLLK